MNTGLSKHSTTFEMLGQKVFLENIGRPQHVKIILPNSPLHPEKKFFKKRTVQKIYSSFENTLHIPRN